MEMQREAEHGLVGSLVQHGRSCARQPWRQEPIKSVDTKIGILVEKMTTG